MELSVNYLAILAAGIASMAIGFLWYSPMVLGKPWMKMMGFTKESMKAAQKEMGKYYALSFVATLVTAYVLSHIIVLSESFYGRGYVATGLTTGFFAWLGFVAPVQMADVIFSVKRSWKLFSINTGYQLTALLAMGIIIGLWS